MNNITDTRTQITAEFLRGLVTYDPIVGRLLWARADAKRWPVKVGSEAARVGKDGYRRVSIRRQRRRYQEHRLVWLYVNGEWPTEEIDHIDGDRGNNRIENLRLASRRQNCANRKRTAVNTSGFKGVTRHQGGRWQAQIGRTGGYLGLYDSPEAAHAAYMAAAIELFGEYSRAA